MIRIRAMEPFKPSTYSWWGRTSHFQKIRWKVTPSRSGSLLLLSVTLSRFWGWRYQMFIGEGREGWGCRKKCVISSRLACMLGWDPEI